MPVDIKAPIPFDKPGEFLHQRSKHFGGGETETVLDLSPGHHTLQLQFADHNHVLYHIRSEVVDMDLLPRAHWQATEPEIFLVPRDPFWN